MAVVDASADEHLAYVMARRKLPTLGFFELPPTVVDPTAGASVFRRYDIVSPDDLRVAVERLDMALSQ